MDDNAVADDEGLAGKVIYSRPYYGTGYVLVRRKDGTSVPVAFVVVPTKVGHLPYYLSFWWTLDPGDPRAAEAR